MIEEIGRLGRETSVVLRICRYYDFYCFLAHLLRGLAHPSASSSAVYEPWGCSAAR